MLVYQIQVVCHHFARAMPGFGSMLLCCPNLDYFKLSGWVVHNTLDMVAISESYSILNIFNCKISFNVRRKIIMLYQVENDYM